jgi:hypothetical protein
MTSCEARRRFTLSDGLIVIAGLAGGLAVTRAMTPDITLAGLLDSILRPRGGWTISYARDFALEFSVIFVVPFVAGWTPACLLLQFGSPRPRWHRLRRQPGFVACLIPSVVAAFAVGVLGVVLPTWGWSSASLRDRALIPVILGGGAAGSGVFWSWVAMRLTGTCRPSPNWTDRLGRFTGAVWVALGGVSAGYAAMTMF